jgi:hypothetical protein
VTIELTTAEAELIERAFAVQGIDPDITSFRKNSLIQGAKFRANSGTPTAEKIR